jgi:hypothetical protein
MKKMQPVTQEYDYGCAIACIAFVLGLSYKETASMLSLLQQSSDRYYVQNLRHDLEVITGQSWSHKFIKEGADYSNIPDMSIVLIRRNPVHKYGHYLVKTKWGYMDPWINLNKSNDIKLAKSGYRATLPSTPMYKIFTP